MQLPTVESETTINNAEITFTTLKIDGHVVSNGGSTIIERGVLLVVQILIRQLQMN